MKIRNFYFPLGLGYLAAVAQGAGHDVKIYDMEKDEKETAFKKTVQIQFTIKSYSAYIDALTDSNHYVWRELEGVLAQFEPDIIGISVWTGVYPAAKKVARIIKRWRHNTVIIVGGIHPTICDEEVAKEENIDFVVRGEGEETFLGLLECLSKGEQYYSNVKGITYKSNGKIIQNELRPLISDIDSLPLPLRNSTFRPTLSKERERGCVITSRGCPYSCTFCSAYKIWGREVRARDIDKVFDEINELYERDGVTFFTFADDTFTLERTRVFRFCDRVANEKLRIKWFANGRIDNMDDEYIYKLKEGKCYVILFGIESASERVINAMGKRQDLGKVLRVRKLFKKLGLLFWITLLIGYPDETEEDLKRTYEFIKVLTPDLIKVNVFVPYPGSQGWENHFINTETIQWEYFSPQSPFTKFSTIDDERWIMWRSKIEQLACTFNNRTLRSLTWLWRLYAPRIVNELRNIFYVHESVL